MKPRAGFTLMEVLMAVTVLGIMTSVAVYSFYNFQVKQQLRDTVVQFAGELNNLRSQARKTSTTWTLQWTGGASTYQVVNNGVTRTRTLDGNIQFDGSGVKTINFQAPYGLLDQSNLSIVLKGRNNSKMAVGLIGMGGKVVIK